MVVTIVQRGGQHGTSAPFRDEDALAAAWRALEESHRALVASSSTGDEFFIRVFEPRSSRSLSSVDAGSIAGEAKLGLPRDFCKWYSLNQASP